jgi:hypothetical protein
VVPKKVELEVVRDDGDEDDEEAVGDGGEDRYRVAWARLCPKDHLREWDCRAC